MQRQPKVKLMQKAEEIAVEQTKRESKRLDLPLTTRLFLADPVRRLLLRVSNPSRSIVLTLNPGLHVIDRPRLSPFSSADAAICFHSTRFILAMLRATLSINFLRRSRGNSFISFALQNFNSFFSKFRSTKPYRRSAGKWKRKIKRAVSNERERRSRCIEIKFLIYLFLFVSNLYNGVFIARPLPLIVLY